MKIHKKFRGIQGKFYCKNNTEFCMFFKKFRIPPEVKKALPWTPYLEVRALHDASRKLDGIRCK
jgi:hypothetical protein